MPKKSVSVDSNPVVLTQNQKDQVFDLVMNSVKSQRQFFDDVGSDPRRSIDDECGYPTSSRLNIETYGMYYDRESVATRVVQIFPQESWKITPKIFEDEDPATNTEFEQAWDDVSNKLLGESAYIGEVGNPIWEVLERVDELSGIGTYGVLLLGINDGKELIEPVEPSPNNELTFINAFEERLVSITQWDTDKTSKRFGQPTQYSITLVDPNIATSSAVSQGTQGQTEVHWTRVIHIADNLGSSSLFGVPRQKPVFNRLADLRKLYGGCAEMYYRGAFPGISLESHPQLGTDIEVDDAAIRTAMENYYNGLQRYMRTTGFTANSLAPQVVDPSPQIDVEITAICIKLGCPKRIFMGSERGELASGQDADTWEERLTYRRNNYITPKMIVRTIDRLIDLEILPMPESYQVEWPKMETASETEKAVIAKTKAEAITTFVQGDGMAILAPRDFFVDILGASEEQAEAWLQNAIDQEPIIVEEEEPDEPT